MARAFALLLTVALLAPVPRAQAEADPVPELRLRLDQHAARRREGFWLLASGLASLAGGAAAAGARSGDEAWLSASVTTASFGAVNALLSLALVDPRGRGRDAIAADTRAPSLQAEAARVAQYHSAQAFALNAGLDVAYLTAGALLVAFGSAEGGEPWQRGSGYALLGQGGFLLGFDLACWIHANGRARAWSRRGARSAVRAPWRSET